MTIVRGTVPACFSDRAISARLLGRLAQPQFILKALRPVAVTLLFAVDDSRRVALARSQRGCRLALAAYRRAIREG